MDIFAKRLRDRARQMNLSDAEVARRAGLAERRYGHYVRGTREPDFATLLRICDVLDLTPNDLLLAEKPPRLAVRDKWLSRISAAARRLEIDDAELAAKQIEAIVDHRNRS